MSETRPRVLSDDDLLTITTFASNRFNAAALTEYMCALKIESRAVPRRTPEER